MTPAGSAGTDGDPRITPGRHRADDDPGRWVKPLGWIAALTAIAGAAGGTVASASDTGDVWSVPSDSPEPRSHPTVTGGPLEVPSIGAVPTGTTERTDAVTPSHDAPRTPRSVPRTASPPSSGVVAPSERAAITSQTELPAATTTTTAPETTTATKTTTRTRSRTRTATPTTTAAATTTAAPPATEEETPVPTLTLIPTSAADPT